MTASPCAGIPETSIQDWPGILMTLDPRGTEVRSFAPAHPLARQFFVTQEDEGA